MKEADHSRTWKLVYALVVIYTVLVIGVLWWFSGVFTP